MITIEMIPVIESTFGFQLYDWQKDYLLGNLNRLPVGRRNGKTFAYCVRFLLSDGEPIDRENICNYIDGYHGLNYIGWFTKYCIEIDRVLKKYGLKTRLLD